MAFVATASTKEPRSFSVGPVKCQIMTWSAASADVAGTVTATALKEVYHISGLSLRETAVASISGNVVTLAFQDPAATVVGTLVVWGR